MRKNYGFLSNEKLTFATNNLGSFDVVKAEIDMTKCNTERSIVHVKFSSLRIKMTNQWEMTNQQNLLECRSSFPTTLHISSIEEAL